jgi:HlyD family secretion protein
MLKNKKILVGFAVLVVIFLIFWLFKGDGSAAASTLATYGVARGPLTISFTQTGTIKAREMTTIKNEVEGRTSIITLIPEGTRVKKGDLLAELDASSLVDSRLDQQIRVQNAEASYVGAKESLEVVKNQAKSDIDKAELALQFAREDLQNYIDGEYPNELKRSEANITLAQEELTRARDTLEWSQTLYKENFLSQTELVGDQLQEKKRTLDLELAQNNLRLLTEFTYKRKLAQLQSDVSQADMALERTKRKASADVVQAEATLLARELEYNRQTERLAKLEEQIRKAKIYAPADGLVIYASSAMTGGRRFNTDPLIEGREVREREDLFYLPTTTFAKAEVSIHESNLEKIRTGLPAVITVDALPGRKYLGKVASIAPLPDAQSMWMNPDLKVYNTEIFLEDSDEALRTGMGCVAEIVVAKYDDCIYIPVQSVIRVGNMPTVFVLRGNAVEERRVELGLDNNRMVHIVSGLSEGEEVLLAPPLRSGTVDSATGQGIGGSDEIRQRVLDQLNNNNVKTVPEETSIQQKQPQGGQDLTEEQREQMRKRFENMTPEERQNMRRRMRPSGEQGAQQPPAEQ